MTKKEITNNIAEATGLAQLVVGDVVARVACRSQSRTCRGVRSPSIKKDRHQERSESVRVLLGSRAVRAGEIRTRVGPKNDSPAAGDKSSHDHAPGGQSKQTTTRADGNQRAAQASE